MSSSTVGRNPCGARTARRGGLTLAAGLAVTAVAFLGGCAAGAGAPTAPLDAGGAAVTRDDLARLERRLQGVEARQRDVQAELARITRARPDAPAGSDTAQTHRWEEVAGTLAAVTERLEGLQADLLERLARIEERQQSARAELTRLARELSEGRSGSEPAGREGESSVAGAAPEPSAPARTPAAPSTASSPEVAVPQTPPSSPVAGSPGPPAAAPPASPAVGERSGAPGVVPPSSPIVEGPTVPGAERSTSPRVVEGLTAPGAVPPAAEGPGAPATEGMAAPPVAMVPGPSAVEPRAGTERRPRDLYEAAYVDFSRGNYALAIGGFREFVRRHPDDALADNAQYWIGEAYLSLAYRYQDGDQVERAKLALQESVEAFRRVAERYPTGDKVAGAIYREALVLLELGEPARARDRLEYLIARFPAAPETRAARERLSQLADR